MPLNARIPVTATLPVQLPSELLAEHETDRGEGRFKGRQLMEMVHEPAALTMVAFTMKQREFD